MNLWVFVVTLLVNRWHVSHAFSSPSHSRQKALIRSSDLLATGACDDWQQEETSSTLSSDKKVSSVSSNRRSILLQTILPALACVVGPTKALADASKTKAKKQQPTLSTVATSPSEAITDKVQFNIRISRADGSFYIRDDETDDDVYYCRVVVGLFGQAVPNHVQRFLSYCQDGITTTKDNEDSETDTSPISYSRSTFSGMDPISGLLLGGVIPSLSVASVMGGTSSALEYRGRLVPASLWLDPTINGQSPLSHISKGLLTHAKFDVTPSFGITTRSDSRDLDATHRVFGRILFDESDGAYDFLDRIRDLPTYSLERPMGDDPDSMGDLVADAVFSAQRDFFRKFAKNIGDSRIDKLYPGKFLRRVEVTQVTVLK